MTLHELIKYSEHEGIVIFDRTSEVLSKRLLCLMMQYADGKFVPTDFYVDTMALAELMSFIPHMETWPDFTSIQTMWDVKVNLVVGLDTSHEKPEYLNFYKKLGGTFPYYKVHDYSIVVLASKDAAIIGCY